MASKLVSRQVDDQVGVSSGCLTDITSEQMSYSGHKQTHVTQMTPVHVCDTDGFSADVMDKFVQMTWTYRYDAVDMSEQITSVSSPVQVQVTRVSRSCADEMSEQMSHISHEHVDAVWIV